MFIALVPGADFTKILKAAFFVKFRKARKDTDDLTVFLPFWDLLSKKLRIKR